MSVLHIINHDNNLPVCGRANFERDMLTGKDYFIANHDDEERCWECGSIIGIDVVEAHAESLHYPLAEACRVALQKADQS